ncbi:PR-1-like protein [Neocallimastix californiae]|jgi:hypothetical protein|uniref:PR-1-like protein n=1 Tax=Neocallimastix californiae TaxID=1754190 RepID=A0A1Y2D7N0_9FUNG|nr:PR-1-like protein [Neocallimastix californiae]|eukprot:ORY54625.1 PR-1-like protein [Neocallimastix californiae]
MKFSISILLSVATLLCGSAKAGLADSEKDKLLSLHKSTRSQVGASNMKSISWDSGLASAAQSYANGCHGMNHSGSPENLAINSGSSNVADLFNQWKDEKSKFLESGYSNKYGGGTYKGHKVGHYSQIVWADNSKVGCGKAQCNGSTYLVCRYGVGNIVGNKVYSGGSSEKKTTSKKTTTTTIKKTTAAVVKQTTNSSAKAPVKTVNNGAKATNANVLPAKNPLNASKVPVAPSTVSSALSGTNLATGPLASPINGINGIGGINGVNGTSTVNAANAFNVTNVANGAAKNTANGAKGANGAGEKEISGIDINNEDGSNTGAVVTGVAITGSVVGAAAAIVFVKKNPNKYEDLKRNLSKKASSVKRGATVVTRRFTTKKVKSPVLDTTTEETTNYRAELTDAMKV